MLNLELEEQVERQTEYINKLLSVILGSDKMSKALDQQQQQQDTEFISIDLIQQEPKQVTPSLFERFLSFDY